MTDPAEFRAWFDKVSYALTMNKELEGYNQFLHAVEVIADEWSAGCHYIACITARNDGTLVLRLHWPTLSQFGLPASTALIEHELLHPINGHVGSRWDGLLEKYGFAAANAAADLVVNGLMRPEHVEALRRQELFVPMVKDYPGMRAGETTTYYAEWLAGHADRKDVQDLLRKCGKPGKGGTEPGGKPQPPGQAGADGSTGGGMGGVMDGAEGKGKAGVKGGNIAGPLSPKGVFGRLPGSTETGVPAPVIDSAAAEVVNRIREDLSQRGELGRGWASGDCREFIEQSKRRAKVPWRGILRRLAGFHLKSLRDHTPFRPSRKHPAFMGTTFNMQGCLWFGIDTSGSMGSRQLRLVEPELRACCRDGMEVWVLQGDTDLQQMTKFRPALGLREFHGRGGTDFSFFLEKAAAAGLYRRPGFAAFYTDGYGGIEQYAESAVRRLGRPEYDRRLRLRPFHTPDGVEMLWLLAGGCTPAKEFRKTVPFGHICVLDDDQEGEE